MCCWWVLDSLEICCCCVALCFVEWYCILCISRNISLLILWPLLCYKYLRNSPLLSPVSSLFAHRVVVVAKLFAICVCKMWEEGARKRHEKPFVSHFFFYKKNIVVMSSMTFMPYFPFVRPLAFYAKLCGNSQRTVAGRHMATKMESICTMSWCPFIEMKIKGKKTLTHKQRKISHWISNDICFVVYSFLLFREWQIR